VAVAFEREMSRRAGPQAVVKTFVNRTVNLGDNIDIHRRFSHARIEMEAPVPRSLKDVALMAAHQYAYGLVR
jgi:hypothetical protein